jgi:CHRD domain
MLPAVAALVLAGCGSKESGGSTGPAPEKFTATLNGTSVVPATASTSSGTLTVEAASGDSILNFSLSVTGLTGITQAHLHTAATGANGNLLVWILPVNGTSAQAPSVQLSGVIGIGDIAPSWVRGTPRLAMDSVKALLRAGRIYADVHTSTFTNGELRGQLERAP